MLNQNWNCWNGPFLVLQDQIMVILPARFVFILTVFWNQLNLMTKLPMLLLIPIKMSDWLCILRCDKHWWFSSGKIMKSWSHHKWASRIETRMMKKFAKSCTPVLLNCGKEEVFGRINEFNYIKGVVRWLMKLVLTMSR